MYFLGGKNCLRCLNVAEIERDDNVDKETRKIDVEAKGAKIPLPNSPTHLVSETFFKKVLILVKLNMNSNFRA